MGGVEKGVDNLTCSFSTVDSLGIWTLRLRRSSESALPRVRSGGGSGWDRDREEKECKLVEAGLDSSLG